jgi:hypothetical protein
MAAELLKGLNNVPYYEILSAFFLAETVSNPFKSYHYGISTGTLAI